MYFRPFLILAFLFLVHSKLLKLTCKQIKQFVDGHNRRRLSLVKGQIKGQPAATNMKQMAWDEEIADKAAKWAKQNKFSHNPDVGLPSKKFRTGENLYLHRTTDPKYKLDLDAAIKSWFDEHKDFKYKRLEKGDFDGAKVIGHYTQMVWAETMYIGCAISQYKDGKWNKTIVVCNYAPKGNKLNDHPYKTSGRRVNGLLCPHKDCKRIYGKRCK